MTRCFAAVMTVALGVGFPHVVQAQTGGWKTVAPGVQRRELRALGNAGGNHRVWLYKPTVIPGKAKVRTVLIAAAGSKMFNGVPLGSGDVPEHLPYAKAGFAVIAYETDGTLSGDGEASIIAAAKAFTASKGGINNAKAALDAVLPVAAFVDRKHIYAVGHSSAATLALSVAAEDMRIAGCVAYAPQPDIPDYLGNFTGFLNKSVPGSRRMIYEVSPTRTRTGYASPFFCFIRKMIRW